MTERSRMAINELPAGTATVGVLPEDRGNVAASVRSVLGFNWNCVFLCALHGLILFVFFTLFLKCLDYRICF